MAKFCSKCGQAVIEGTRFCKHCGAPVSAAAPQQNQKPAQQPVYTQPVNSHLPAKSKLAAALLAFFLGGLGVHRFYLGQVGLGFLYIVIFLLVGWTGISSIIALIDFIVIITMSDERFCEKYNCRIG